MPKWLRWTIGTVVVIAILRDPVGAAHTVHNLFMSLWTFGGTL